MNDHDDFDLPEWGIDDAPPLNSQDAVSSSAGKRFGKLTLYTDADAEKAQPRGYFLKGIISPGEMSTIYGEPGCGKSFLALYMVRAIVQGRQVFGKRVRRTNALFLALEGISGFEKRLKAQILTHNATEGFAYIAQPVDLFDDISARESVIAAAQDMDAGIIVIDTLNRAIGGGSENDPADMGKFIQNIDAIRLATGAHVIIIHHSGKNSALGMRGHSSLLGAADAVLEVVRQEKSKTREVKVQKSKDDADGAQFYFELNVLEMGDDDDGDPITTCVVAEIESEESKKKKTEPLKDREKLWLRELQELFSRDGMTELVKPEVGMSTKIMCATRDTVREWCKQRGLVGVAHGVAKFGVLSSTDRAMFGRTLEGLKLKNKIGSHGEWIWLCD